MKAFHIGSVGGTVGINDESIGTWWNDDAEQVRVRPQRQITEFVLAMLLADVESNARTIPTI